VARQPRSESRQVQTLTFTDPFGLCKPADEFCRKVRDFFAAHGGAVAAPIVQALDNDEWTLRRMAAPRGGSETKGSVTLGYTDLVNDEIEVNEAASFGQQVTTINHEFWQHALPRRGEHSGSGHDPWAQKEARTLSNMRGAPGIKNGVSYGAHVEAAAKILELKLPPWNTRGVPEPK
jgi:hypothetical protein